jgi:hypothetical protein
MRVIVDKDLLDRLVAGAEAYGEPTIPAPIVSVPEPEVTSNVLAWGSKVSAPFRERVRWIATTLKMDANYIMACIAWESGESFSPSKKNMAGSGATGLIQFMPTTAKGLGTTTDKLAAMTAEDQLNFVYKYFLDAIKRHGPLVTLEDVYMSILWPAAIGQPSGYVLFDKGKQPTAFRQNAGLDSDKNGKVTKYEAASHVREKLVKGLKRAA